ncbi:hypothetical protein VP01_195g1 [Puccinia sorghi]|uniref:Uncharacterized protein n=1 Tax=Puccinia sorghi TaxID=27349 RepID=A0A0L6VDT1_9BASI|nr:hypothetical protein VP01_195g1 [Puccinia sorghi]
MTKPNFWVREVSPQFKREYTSKHNDQTNLKDKLRCKRMREMKERQRRKRKYLSHKSWIKLCYAQKTVTILVLENLRLTACTMPSAAAIAETCSYSLAYKDSTMASGTDDPLVQIYEIQDGSLHSHNGDGSQTARPAEMKELNMRMVFLQFDIIQLTAISFSSEKSFYKCVVQLHCVPDLLNVENEWIFLSQLQIEEIQFEVYPNYRKPEPVKIFNLHPETNQNHTDLSNLSFQSVKFLSPLSSDCLVLEIKLSIKHFSLPFLFILWFLSTNKKTGFFTYLEKPVHFLKMWTEEACLLQLLLWAIIQKRIFYFFLFCLVNYGCLSYKKLHIRVPATAHNIIPPFNSQASLLQFNLLMEKILSWCGAYVGEAVAAGLSSSCH